MDSILTSVKKLLGIDKEYDHFDMELIIHINSALSVLTQLGVGPEQGLAIFNEKDAWFDLLADDPRLEMVKTYVFLKVKMVFDPPSVATVIESFKRTISELEWRIKESIELNREED